MHLKKTLYAATALALVSAAHAQAETITIATVNNGDMIRMQGLTADFTEKTGHEVEWVTLEENVLRQRVTQDIAAKGGQFDIMTIGMYETPIWAAQDWLVSLNDLAGRILRYRRHPSGDARRSVASTARSMLRRSTAKAR